MQIIDLKPQNTSSLCATIGIFEGVHLAHQALISECLQYSKEHNLTSCIITFNVQTDLTKTTNKIPLFSEDEKIKQLSQTGVEKLIIIDLDERFKQMSHLDFIKLLLKIGIKALVVGFDFTYGFNRLGNVNSISDDSNGSIDVLVIDKKEMNGAKIGTRQIKEALGRGDILEANQLLGFPYYIILDGGSAQQVLLLADGKYEVLINQEPTSITIQKGQIVTPINLDNKKITFQKNKE